MIPTARVFALPYGFQETIVWSGLTQPTAIRFAPDGHVFVTEKSGIVKVFDSISDPTPKVFADLRTEVHNYWDRGLLGLAVDPNFPANPYVYVLYTLDAAAGGTPPRWGTFGGTSDDCPDPPGGTSGGCVVAGRLSRLQATGDVMVPGGEQALLENWCQQFPSHSIGTLLFGPDGALYVSAGDGASFTFVDYGQTGFPVVNPCGDPPGGVGGTQTPPTAEGGALRAQDIRTIGDTVGFNGTILRVDPATGGPLPDNPLADGSIPGAERIIAHGLRNPFRMTMRPGTSELWIGDVGWSDWEEIDRLDSVSDRVVANFGWPCYEGIGRQPGYQSAGLAICQGLYDTPGAVTDPVYTYSHAEQVVPGEACSAGSSSISALAFYPGGNYPQSYDGALFFADYSRNCIWTMSQGANGEPDPATRATFAAGTSAPVDLEVGPAGDLFYVDINNGRIIRIQYTASDQPPTAVVEADVTNGPAPLVVQLDGSLSSDPDVGDTLLYAWDFDGTGDFLGSTEVAPQHTFGAGTYTVRLRVTDSAGASSIASIVVTAGNTAPQATISTPLASTKWNVGDTITFSGGATDSEEGTLPGSALTWTLILHHCPSNCHTHTIQSFIGASGSFAAPDHDYPTFLELQLTATDSGGLTDTKSVLLYPNTTMLTFDGDPAGLTLGVGPSSGVAPLVRTVIVGSSNSVSAPSPQSLADVTYAFVSWSDGGLRSHLVVAPANPVTYVASFTIVTPTPTATPTSSPTATVSATATPSATVTPSPTATATTTVTATITAAASASATPTPTSSDTPSPTPAAAACSSDADCDDGNLCTQDSCDPGGSCVHSDTSLPIADAVVELRALDDPGKAVFLLRGNVLVPLPLSPTLDPSRDGLRVDLIDTLGRVRDTLELPPGVRDGGHPVGWSTNRSRKLWRYANVTGDARVRTAHVRVDDTTGSVGVRLSAHRGTLPLTPADVPVGIRILVGTNPARCGALTFNPVGSARPICNFSRTGTSIQCR
ncbi:MAG: PQQ-dependent sugar dehydrogenase [Deltaproteobacteria bacterium]|nr:PQQ-dependent sugar dehydrogenase [Deltaproteobacteria bacterium]